MDSRFIYFIPIQEISRLYSFLLAPIDFWIIFLLRCYPKKLEISLIFFYCFLYLYESAHFLIVVYCLLNGTGCVSKFMCKKCLHAEQKVKCVCRDAGWETESSSSSDGRLRQRADPLSSSPGLDRSCTLIWFSSGRMLSSDQRPGALCFGLPMWLNREAWTFLLEFITSQSLTAWTPSLRLCEVTSSTIHCCSTVGYKLDGKDSCYSLCTIKHVFTPQNWHYWGQSKG